MMKRLNWCETAPGFGRVWWREFTGNRPYTTDSTPEPMLSERFSDPQDMFAG